MAGGMRMLGSGACMAGGHAWQRGVCGQRGMHGRGVHGGGHVWQGGMCGRVACMVAGMCGGGGMHGQGGHVWQGCAWQGACIAGGMHGQGVWVHGREVCMAGGHVWQGGVCGRGACVAGGLHGRGHVWQGGCMAGGMHATHVPHPNTTRYSRSMRGRYASYWNEFLCFRCFHLKDSQSKNNSLHWQQVYPYMSVLPISNVHINLLLSNS